MSTKLSFSAISATLATLGATSLVACGGSARGMPEYWRIIWGHPAPPAATRRRIARNVRLRRYRSMKSGAGDWMS